MNVYYFHFPEWFQFGFRSQTGNQLHCIVTQSPELQVIVLILSKTSKYQVKCMPIF